MWKASATYISNLGASNGIGKCKRTVYRSAVNCAAAYEHNLWDAVSDWSNGDGTRSDNWGGKRQKRSKSLCLSEKRRNISRYWNIACFVRYADHCGFGRIHQTPDIVTEAPIHSRGNMRTPKQRFLLLNLALYHGTTAFLSGIGKLKA